MEHVHFFIFRKLSFPTLLMVSVFHWFKVYTYGRLHYNHKYLRMLEIVEDDAQSSYVSSNKNWKNDIFEHAGSSDIKFEKRAFSYGKIKVHDNVAHHFLWSYLGKFVNTVFALYSMYCLFHFRIATRIRFSDAIKVELRRQVNSLSHDCTIGIN